MAIELTTQEVDNLFRTAQRQFPFAMMKALNQLALRGQQIQREHQEKVFEIRQQQYFKYAVKIPKGGFATKKRLTSRVTITPPMSKVGGQKHDIFQRQEKGGIRVAIQGRKYLAIPQEDVPRTQTGLVRASGKPLNLKRTFFVQFKGNVLGMFRRIGKRQKGFTAVAPGVRLGLRQDPNVQFMYLLIPRANIQAVYDFYTNMELNFRVNWEKIFNSELIKAFATANVRGFKVKR